MSETLQRTEQVITVAELREILGARGREELRRPNFQGHDGGSRRSLASRLALLAVRMMIDTNAVMSAFGRKKRTCRQRAPQGAA